MCQSGNPKNVFTGPIASASSSSRRTTREELYRDLVFSLSRRSTCKRAKVGAIVVQGHHVIGMGYNGSPPGYPHCLDVGCWHLPTTSDRCRGTIHAEMNAILNAATSDGGLSGGDLSLWSSLRPCIDCLKAAVVSGISHVYYFEHREDPEAAAFELYLKNGHERTHMRVEYVTHL